MASENSSPESAEERRTGSEQHLQRLRKLRELVAEGIDPFGGRLDGLLSTRVAGQQFEDWESRATDAAAADAGSVAEMAPVRLAGRLTAIRVMGKSIFADLKDQHGRLQVYVRKNSVGDDGFARFKSFDLGDIATCQGTLFRTRAGEVTLKVAAFDLVAKSLHPLPEKWHGLTDVEQRYRQRYLDLMVNDRVRTVFMQRAEVIHEIRRFLVERGFTEVETPMLQAIPGGAAARPFETFYNALNCPMYLRIAPELYLKRLLVGGFEKVFEINRNFRNEGLDRRHNPEFTMIELYQAYSDCRGMMELLEELIVRVARKVFGTLHFPWGEGGEVIDLTPPWRRVSYRQLIEQRMGEDWFGLDQRAMAERGLAEGLDVDHRMECWEITHEAYEKLIERSLLPPTFVIRLPAVLVPLAKRCADDPELVDVFELEIGGQEIAPGYSELNDPLEQRARFEEQARRATKVEDASGGRMDQDFLTAMEYGMPPAGGAGMGIDRLLMLLTGMESIRDVILFPQMRPENR